ncbi:MAG: putative exported protein [Deltaproteobacteria bacterium]|nr:putative exported protein [Deltaproteobacteria bacterium]
MRKGLFGIGWLVLFLVMTGLASAGQFGPTEPTANPGKFSLGVGYFWEDTKWDVFDGTLRTQSHQAYLQGSFAPVKNFEIFGRLGGANLETKDTDLDLKDDAKLFGTLGMKVMFYEYKMFGLGAFAQGTYHFQDYKDSESFAGVDVINGIPISIFETVDFKIKDYYDVQAGLSGQVKINQCIIYGGPFVYFGRAKLHVDAMATASAQGRTATASGSIRDTMEEKTTFGGFLGTKIAFTKQLGLTLEGQYRDEFSGGAFLSYSF